MCMSFSLIRTGVQKQCYNRGNFNTKRDNTIVASGKFIFYQQFFSATIFEVLSIKIDHPWKGPEGYNHLFFHFFCMPQSSPENFKGRKRRRSWLRGPCPSAQ